MPPSPSTRNGCKWVTQLLARLKDLKWRYVEGPTKRGRAEMGIVNSTGCTSVWGSTLPVQPVPLPLDLAPVPGFAVRGHGPVRGPHGEDGGRLQGGAHGRDGTERRLQPEEHDAEFTYYNWEKFSEEEWKLCPPVVSIGGDGAMYDIGFQNLSRALMTGMPVKILVVDTQVYSNTGGQACTSGFISQVADMSPYGKKGQGKKEIRKEISVIGMAHRRLRHAERHLQPDAPDRELHRRPQQPPPGAVQHLRRLPAGTRRRRRHVDGTVQAGGRVARLPAVPLRPGQGVTFSECVSWKATRRWMPTGRSTP
jgi:hypothetical protein